MDKQILKQILRDNQQEVERYVVEPRELALDGFPCRVPTHRDICPGV